MAEDRPVAAGGFRVLPPSMSVTVDVSVVNSGSRRAATSLIAVDRPRARWSRPASSSGHRRLGAHGPTGVP